MVTPDLMTSKKSKREAELARLVLIKQEDKKV